MYPIKKCQKITIDQGTFYFGESTKEKSVGYLELKPNSSLTLHNRLGGTENLIQVKGKCVMAVFDTPKGVNHTLNPGDKLTIKPEGTWHIHANPFDEPCLTYWHFDGDIRKYIKEIKNKVK